MDMLPSHLTSNVNQATCKGGDGTLG